MLLVTRLNIGGPASQAIQLAKGLAPELPILLAAGKPSPTEGEIIDPDVLVRRVPLVRPIRPMSDLRALGSVRQLITEIHPPLVHTHMAKAGALGRLAALSSVPMRSRPRLVHTFHGHVLSGYFPGPQETAFLQLERALARHTDLLVTVSPEVRDELLDLGIGKQAQYRVIPVGLDLDACLALGTPEGAAGRLRSALGLGADIPLVGVLGRLVPIKDHATLFAALAALPEVHLAVLGDGELRSSLEALSRELGIADRTHFTGWWPDVSSALADLDLVVLSSRNEGTPLALIEALAAGRPVVATDVGGVRSVVQDGETGWLCPAGDAPALARLVARALAEPVLAAGLAREGRHRVAERFGRDRMLADHRALYTELLSGRS